MGGLKLNKKPCFASDGIGLLQNKLKKFKLNASKVTMGSVLEQELWQYYISHGLKFMDKKLKAKRFCFKSIDYHF